MKPSKRIKRVLSAVFAALLLLPSAGVSANASSVLGSSDFMEPSSEPKPLLFRHHRNPTQDNAIKRGNTAFPDPIPLQQGNQDGMEYWLYTPDTPQENMPLVVYLHGSHMAASIEEAEGFPKWLADGTLGAVPAYVLIPLLPEGQRDWIGAKEMVKKLIEAVAEEKSVDRSCISLTGFSMGGTGAWNLAASYPALFFRVAPCSGGIKITSAAIKNLSTLSIWAFVGTEDRIVDPQITRDCAEALMVCQADIRVTEFAGADHTVVASKAFLEEGLMQWLLGEPCYF